jgi:hypothetical protein
MRRRRFALLSTLLCALACATATPAGAVPEDFFGVNGQMLPLLSAQDQQRHLAAMAAGGLQFVRHDASWVHVEPEPPDPVTGAHAYNWDVLDRQVALYAGNGLRWLPIIDYSTAWSGRIRGDYFSPPADSRQYAAYAAAVARRYGQGGDFWRERPQLRQLPVTKYEIWNEENTEFFWRGQADAPERYAELYLAARGAIKAVDPDARVIVGGLALEKTGVTDPDDFVTRMYRHRPELVGNVDAVGFHPYTPGIGGVYSKLREIRATLSRVGAGNVPLELTELGWTTVTASESHRAESLARLADELPRSDCNVASLAPHTWLTSERNAADPEDWFGIFNLDGTPKPSGGAYLGSVQRVRSGAVSGPVSICSPATSLAPPWRGRRPLVVLMRVKRLGRRKPHMIAAVRCPGGCAMRVAALGVSRIYPKDKRIRPAPLWRRSLSYSKRLRRFRIRVSPGWRLVRLDARARDRSGRVKFRTAAVRFRPAR